MSLVSFLYSKSTCMEMERIEWKVEGMTCSNCALSISKYLNKQGLSEIKVNVLDGGVSFDTPQKIDETVMDFIRVSVNYSKAFAHKLIGM